MRIIFAILGIAGMAIAISAGFVHSATAPAQQHFWVNRAGGAACGAAGFAFLIAAVKGYRGHWSFVIGLILLYLGFVGLGLKLDDYRTGKTEKPEVAALVIVMMVTFGVLSLWSAHK